MSKNQSAWRTDEEWFELITKCRQSGLSDTEWCFRNGISRSSLSQAATRLRKKSFAIPKKQRNSNPLDFTSCQEVVKVDILQDNYPDKYTETQNCIPAVPVSTPYLDNSHTIEIQFGASTIRLSNDADPNLVRAIVSSFMQGGSNYAG